MEKVFNDCNGFSRFHGIFHHTIYKSITSTPKETENFMTIDSVEQAMKLAWQEYRIARTLALPGYRSAQQRLAQEILALSTLVTYLRSQGGRFIDPEPRDAP